MLRGRRRRRRRCRRPCRSSRTSSRRSGIALRPRQRADGRQAAHRDDAGRPGGLRLRRRRPGRPLLRQRQRHARPTPRLIRRSTTGSTATAAASASRTSPTRPACRDAASRWAPRSADYDNDGDPDLFVPGVGQPTLYRNNGDGPLRGRHGRVGHRAPRPGRSPRPGSTSIAMAASTSSSSTTSTGTTRRTASAAIALRNLRVYCHPEVLHGPGQPAVPQQGRRHVRGHLDGERHRRARRQGHERRRRPTSTPTAATTCS